MPKALSPYVVLLPGRDASWLRLCHAQPTRCFACMEAIARYLASEMKYDVGAALDRPATSYQADVSGSAASGRELRRLTVAVCVLRTSSRSDIGRLDQLWVADDSLQPAAEPSMTVFTFREASPPTHGRGAIFLRMLNPIRRERSR